MSEADRIQKEDRDYCDKIDRQRDIIRADKKILSNWIEYYLYNYPELDPPRESRTKKQFIKMQNELEEILWKFQEEVDAL
jgi:hypothetical protein